MRTTEQLATDFRKIIKGRNFMTPSILSFTQCGKYIVELSKGKGIFSDYLYGVTVADTSTGKRDEDLSTCFTDQEDAEEYISEIEG